MDDAGLAERLGSAAAARAAALTWPDAVKRLVIVWSEGEADQLQSPYMGYRSELESRLAKKTTKAIVDYHMLEEGDRVMVGLSGGKDSWALLQILDVLRQRAPIRSL
jgi:hypothetical protein